MDAFNSPKGLARLWSALMNDYEYTLHQYMIQKGSTFSHLAKCARDTQITLLYFTSLSHGRKRDIHHERVGEIILTTAKDMWLQPGKFPKYLDMSVEDMVTDKNSTMNGNDVDVNGFGSVAPNQEPETPASGASGFGSGAPPLDMAKQAAKAKFDVDFDGNEVQLKYQLGAFFLTYIMYDRQPYSNFCKINIDPKDLAEWKLFEERIMATPGVAQEEYQFILNKLLFNNAFNCTDFADRYSADCAGRSYLNAKNNEMIPLVKVDKKIMETLAHGSVSEQAQEHFGKYISLKQNLLKETTATVPGLVHAEPIELNQKPTETDASGWICRADPNEDGGEQPLVENNIVSVLESQQGIGEVATASTQVQEMASKPFFTHAALLGNETTSRVFMTEATKRLKRLQMIAERQNEEASAAKAAGGPRRGRGAKIVKKPYKNESGVFGSVKDDHLGEAERQKVPTRLKASYNLWNYIRGKGYNPDTKDTLVGNMNVEQDDIGENAGTSGAELTGEESMDTDMAMAMKNCSAAAAAGWSGTGMSLEDEPMMFSNYPDLSDSEASDD